MTSKTTTRLRAATRRCKPAQLATCVDAVIVTLTLGTYLLTAAPLRADEITLVESGSTLIYPLFNVWAIEYTTTHPGVRIVTNATGSEQGINQAISGAANIGTSDAYMSDAEIRRNPQIINVAMAISAQTVNYNLPGFNGAALKLDGPVLAGIYAGRIRAWDDKAIGALNPGLALPHHDIIPVRRADGAGDTFIIHSISFVHDTMVGGKVLLRQIDSLARCCRRFWGHRKFRHVGGPRANTLFDRLYWREFPQRD